MHVLTRSVQIQFDETANAAVVKFGPDFPQRSEVVDTPIEIDGNVVAILTSNSEGLIVQLELLRADRQLGPIVE